MASTPSVPAKRTKPGSALHALQSIATRRSLRPTPGGRASMRAVTIVGLVIGAVLAAAGASLAAPAGEITVVDNVLGPEGPLVVDGKLYYVGWVSGTLSRWDGRSATVLNDLAGCGHNGLALTHHSTFLLACTDDKGAILELDLNGKLIRRWDADDKGAPMTG